MKRTFIAAFFLLVFLNCFNFKSKAQTYNVGAGGTYVTLNEAVTAYNSMTLTQPVVFLLTDASYTITSALTINTNATASSTNTLTIKPAPGTTVAISGSLGGAAIFNISGDYIFIDGSNNGSISRDMTINNTNPGGRCINIGGADQANSADNITIKNCSISAGGGSNYNVSLMSSNYISAGYFNKVTIQNNIIQRAIIGIYILAATGPFQNGTTVNILDNDLARTGADAIANTGISLSGLSFGCTIQNNTIGNFAATLTSPAKGITVSTACSTVVIKNNNILNISYAGANAASPIGIEINSAGGNNILVEGNTVSGLTSSGTSAINGILVSSSAINVVVQKNIVSDITSSRAGVYAFGIQFNPSSTTNMAKLHNNFIYGIASGSGGVTAGIYAPGSGLRQIAYNSVLITNAPGESHAFICSTSTVGRINCYNNNFINRSPSTTNSYAISQTSNIVNTTINYNNIEGTPLGKNSAASLTTLAEVQAVFGANTVNIPPVFLSATDLHMAATGNEALDNKGTPLADILTDIDDSSRSASTPDIGADEFGTVSGGALVINCSAPASRFCPGSVFNLSYTVQGGTPASGNVYTAQLSNLVGDFTNPTIIGTLTSTAISGVISVTMPLAASGSFYRIRVLSSTPAYTGNNNGTDLVIQKPFTGAITGLDAVAAGVETPYSVVAHTGSTYLWTFTGGVQNTGTNTNSVTGTFNTPGSQQVSVTETDDIGCVGNTVIKAVTVSSTAGSVWTGNVDTDWGNAANWENNQVPGVTSEVIIPSGRPRYPVVSVSTTVKSISAAAGASIIVATGVQVIIISN